MTFASNYFASKSWATQHSAHIFIVEVVMFDACLLDHPKTKDNLKSKQMSGRFCRRLF
jgi:hypothetical protein